MKKSFLLLIFILAPTASFCVPWGLLSEVEKEPSALYFIDKYSKGQEIIYCLDDYFSTSPLDGKDLVEDSFNSWPSVTKKFIEASGREEEFKDILPILSKKVNLKRITCGKVPQKLTGKKGGIFEKDTRQKVSGEDLRIIVVPDGKVPDVCNSKHSAGCHIAGLKDSLGKTILPTVIIVGNNSDIVNIITHEIGHSFGLSDQYLSERSNSDPKYGTTKIYPSIMDNSSVITCDDSEGLINALDCLALGNKRGGSKGWASICPDSDEVYINCSAENRAPFINRVDAIGLLHIAQYNEDGSISSNEDLSVGGDWKIPHGFSLPRKDFSDIKRDKQGRVISFKDKDGNETKIDYSSQGKVITFSIVKKGDLLTAPISYSISSGTEKGTKFFLLLGNLAGIGGNDFGIYSSENNGNDISTIIGRIYLNNYKGQDNYPLQEYKLTNYGKDDVSVMIRKSGNIKEYSLLSKGAKGDYVVGCLFTGKSLKAKCVSATVNNGSANVSEKDFFLPVLALSFQSDEATEKTPVFKHNNNISQAVKSTLEIAKNINQFLGYLNNFEDNYNWATGATPQAQNKKELLDSLRDQGVKDIKKAVSSQKR